MELIAFTKLDRISPTHVGMNRYVQTIVEELRYISPTHVGMNR